MILTEEELRKGMKLLKQIDTLEELSEELEISNSNIIIGDLLSMKQVCLKRFREEMMKKNEKKNKKNKN